MRSISESVSAYLSEKNVYENIDTFYSPKINCFKEYLLDKLNYPDSIIGIQRIKELHSYSLYESVKYYIEKSRQSSNKQNHVNRIGTLDDYFSCVLMDYFEFLNSNDIRNISLLSNISEWKRDRSLYLKEINKIALEFGLISCKVMLPFKEEEISKLLDKCEDTIDYLKDKDVFRKAKHQDYKKFTISIILKLIYYIGIKYRVIERIELNDVNTHKCEISIGEYNIEFPLVFAEQLERYVSFRNQIPYANNNPLFFIKSEKTGSVYNNTFVADFLYDSIKKRDTTGLAKYTIINKYMKNNVPQIIIKDITTFDYPLIEDCGRYIDYKGDYSRLDEIVNCALNYKKYNV